MQGEMLLQYGPLGLMVLGLAWIGKQLWDDLKASQEARLTDMREANKRLEEVAKESARAMDALTDVVRGK